MPKQTFYNLPTEKRDMIVQAAMEEFAVNTFHRATIDNIVKGAGIPKGSFYQYFENKEDIYKYILELIENEKEAFLKPLLNHMEEMSFSEFIRFLYLSGIQFEEEQSTYQSLRNQLIMNTAKELREEILESSVPKSNKIIEEVLSFYVNKGELKQALDIKLTAHIMTSVTISLSKYLINHDNVDSIPDIMHTFERMLEIFENGIKKNR